MFSSSNGPPPPLSDAGSALISLRSQTRVFRSFLLFSPGLLRFLSCLFALVSEALGAVFALKRRVLRSYSAVPPGGWGDRLTLSREDPHVSIHNALPGAAWILRFKEKEKESSRLSQWRGQHARLCPGGGAGRGPGF